MSKFSRVIFAAAFAVGMSFVLYGADTPPEGVELVDLTTATSGSVVEDTNPYDSGSYRGSKAFDDKMSGGGERWLAKKGGVDTPTYVVYKFNEATKVNAYRIYNGGSGGANHGTRAPKAWVMEASNDNANWTTLDSRAVESNWSSAEARYFACSESANVGKYLYYRLTLLDNNGDSIYQIHEICFYYVISFSIGECSAVRESDGRYTVSGTVLRGAVDSVTAFARTDDESKTIEVQLGTDVVADEEVSGALSGLETGLTYELSFGAKKGSDEIEKPIDTVYAGELALTFVSNAKELGCVPGIVKVSRASASKYPLVVNYALTDGTAKVGKDYVAGSGTITIPANESECAIEIIPLVNPDATVDTDLTVSIVSGNYAVPAAGVTMTIENAAIPGGVNVWVAGSTSDGLASTADNWSLKVIPSAGNADSLKILVDGIYSSHDLTWDAGVNGLADTVTSWTQTEDYTGTVTMLTTFPSYANSTFKIFTVTGAMTIDGGTLTHPLSVNLDDNGSIKITDIADFRARYTYRLNVSAGSMIIGSNGRIDAVGKGHRQRKITANMQHIYPSHGGRFENTTIGCYGNPKYPEDIGYASNAAGTDNAGKHAAGGGAVKLTVLGSCVIDGEISVDGEVGASKISAGAAGSVLIEAPSITGVGVIHADGVFSQNTSNIGGAGGRVALLTTTPVDTATLTVRAGGVGVGKYSPAGTVYLKDSTSTHGTLYLNNPLHLSSANYRNRGIFVTIEEGVDWTFDKIRMYGDIQLIIPTGTTLNLPNGFASIVSENTDGRYSTIYYRGGNFNIGDAATQVMSGKWNFTPVSNFVFNAHLVVKGGANIGFCGYFDQDTFSNGDPTTADRLFCEVMGDMDIQADGLMSGYCAGPMAQGGSRLGYSAGNHGGRYGSPTAGNIGSVFNPLSTGVGQSNSYGHQKPGAAMKLVVTGALNVDGMISSDSYAGTDGLPHAGCPGSVNITASKLTGSGKISAKYNMRSSGGRIAVRLTDSASTFDDFSGTIKAFGGGGSDTKPISAGTIYLQAGNESEKGGTIIIDNNGNTSQLYTPVMATANIQSDKYVTDEIADFKNASLVVENKARVSVEIADNGGNFNMKSLKIAADSKLDLFGNTLTVKSAKLGDTTLAAGTYAAGDTALGDVVVDTVGGGSLVVQSATRPGLRLILR